MNLVSQPKKSVIQKIFQMENGEYIMATFLVVEWQGQVRGRLVSTEIISDSDQCLFYFLEDQANRQLDHSYVPAFFEFSFQQSDFSFFISQPTRAPSLHIA